MVIDLCGNMVKHISVRFAWHDNYWNGRICKSPERNVYCIGNYSLLSLRIQRRINIDVEKLYKNQAVADVVKQNKYLPPCYWSINAQGEKTFQIEDPHPFSDTRTWGKKFSAKVPPLKDVLRSYSVFTWCFKISFEREREDQLYPHPEELQERVNNYINELQKGKSIVFFYSNYSNPITGDKYQYLLLGAGLLKEVDKPKKYEIPVDLLNEVRAKQKMENFPELVWQFQISLDPDSIVILPYQEYLDWIEKNDGANVNEKWKKLEEVAIPINEENLIPHFKYVSMHIPHDKCIYLLYMMRKSLEKMKEHRLVDYAEIKKIEERLDKLLSIAWRVKGRYPGFSNVLYVLLKNDFSKDRLKKLVPEIETYIANNYGSLENFFDNKTVEPSISNPELKRALDIISKKKDVIRFLSLFDFSILQFDRVMEIMNKKQIGFESLKSNPYLLLEKYQYDTEDKLTIDESDYGLGLYQIDVALIPDPMYVDWSAMYDAQSPERLRAVITDILYHTAFQEGNSCLTRSEIIKHVENYALYYINTALKLDVEKLLEYEKQAIFREKFVITKTFGEEDVYQLKLIREVEKIIEDFILFMLKKNYELLEKDQADIESIISEERTSLKNRLDINERKRLYGGILSNGVFFLSGRVGSGKTSAIIQLVKKFRSDGTTPIFIFTPTGKANLVIRSRLKEVELHNDPHITVSTIHRFLYTKLFDYIHMVGPQARVQIFEISKYIERILSGKIEALSEFRSLAKLFKLRPKVVIIDEASMVDEILLAALFTMISADSLKHLIIVGDEKQLPPIGIGRPFIDTIYHFKKCYLDNNYIRLESNLRFNPAATIGTLAEFFSSEKLPFPSEIDLTLRKLDDTVKLYFFENREELKKIIKSILQQIGASTKSSISEMFSDVFEVNGSLYLDKVQIICPRRVGDFGSIAINVGVIREGRIDFSPRTKVICEKNIYTNAIDKHGKSKRVLGLANGSIGYIKPDSDVYFEDLEDIEAEYRWVNLYPIMSEISGDFTVLKTERDIDFGYAITVHKSQGSDFDHVIFILPEVSPFIMKELLYTAFTRPKMRLYLVVHNSLKDELPLILCKVYENSAIEQRKTLLFGYKTSPLKPYLVTLRNGNTIEVKSKIECIIVKALDEAEVDFEYEPKEFFEEYHIIPDFKLVIDGQTYYIEHLGNMNNPSYRNRWFQKFEIYKKLGLADVLITTSESEEKSNVELNIKNIVSDVKNKNLRKTEGGYSKHHYYI